jgi:hypothetical protein
MLLKEEKVKSKSGIPGYIIFLLANAFQTKITPSPPTRKLKDKS